MKAAQTKAATLKVEAALGTFEGAVNMIYEKLNTGVKGKKS